VTLSQYDIAQQTERLLRRPLAGLGGIGLLFCHCSFFHRVSLAVVSDQLMAESISGRRPLAIWGGRLFLRLYRHADSQRYLSRYHRARLDGNRGMLLGRHGRRLYSALAQSLAVATAGPFSYPDCGVSGGFCVRSKKPRPFGSRPSGVCHHHRLHFPPWANTGPSWLPPRLAFLVAAIGWRNSFLVVAVLVLIGGPSLLVAGSRSASKTWGLPSDSMSWKPMKPEPNRR